MHRRPCRVLGVDAELVAEDAVRADRPDAEGLADDPQRVPQLGADHLAADGVRPQQVAEVLGADHRLPRARQRTDRPRADGHRDPAGAALVRGRRDGLGQRPGGLDAADRRHRVVGGRGPVDRGVGVRPGRDREHVTAAVIERLVRPAGPASPVDQVRRPRPAPAPSPASPGRGPASRAARPARRAARPAAGHCAAAPRRAVRAWRPSPPVRCSPGLIPSSTPLTLSGHRPRPAPPAAATGLTGPRPAAGHGRPVN